MTTHDELHEIVGFIVSGMGSITYRNRGGARVDVQIDVRNGGRLVAATAMQAEAVRVYLAECHKRDVAWLAERGMAGGLPAPREVVASWGDWLDLREGSRRDEWRAAA